MVHSGSSAERRDASAADRDDAADCRDLTATNRDEAAEKRDVHAGDRAVQAGRSADDLDAHLAHARQQILDRLSRLENVSVDPADWPDLSSAGLARLRAHASEQRRLAALDRMAIGDVLDDLRREISHSRRDRLAGARDRGAAARDRQSAAGDRRSAGQDRDDSASDRDQAAIERQQLDPDAADGPRPEDQAAGTSDSLTDQVEQAVASSQQRIVDGRTYLARGRKRA